MKSLYNFDNVIFYSSFPGESTCFVFKELAVIMKATDVSFRDMTQTIKMWLKGKFPALIKIIPSVVTTISLIQWEINFEVV